MTDLIATLKCYQTNADLYVDGNCYSIHWDGLTFDDEDEYYDWIVEALEPAAECYNYSEVRKSLEISTDELCPSEYDPTDLPKTKRQLVKWIEYQQEQGNSVPCVINGGGFTWISPDNDMSSLAYDKDYKDALEYLEAGQEYPDFKDCMTSDELEGMTFVRLPHRTGYNQENFDYQFGIWD